MEGYLVMPQIEHSDLVALGEDKVNLKKTEVDDQRAQVNRLSDRIEAKISASPGYGFVKTLHAGSESFTRTDAASPVASPATCGRATCSTAARAAAALRITG